MKIENDVILHWLQDFYANILQEGKIPLIDKVTDEDLGYQTFHKIPSFSGMYSLTTVDNPGWVSHFNYHDTEFDQNPWYDMDYNLQGDDCFIWLDLYQRESQFNAVGGPLYLIILLEAFRCYITKQKFEFTEVIFEGNTHKIEEMHNQLKTQNVTLSWLEEFVYDYCDQDEISGSCYIGMKLITTSEGWVVSFVLETSNLSDEVFEDVTLNEPDGIVKCYKRNEKFIIRCHFQGLISGLNIFREWVEQFPKGH